MKLGKLIFDYRTAHKISQRMFAEQCGLSNAYISMLESGKNPKTGKPITPDINSLIKLSKGMGESLQDMLEKIDSTQISLSLYEPDPLTDDETLLIETYRSLSPEGQQYLQMQAQFAREHYLQKNHSLSNPNIG